MDKYLQLKIAFEKQANPTYAKQMSAYQRYQFKFYGLRAPERRKLYKNLLKIEKQTKRIDWPFLDLCYQDDHREFQYFVRDYLSAMQKYLVYEDIARIKPYLQTKQWWDSIDGFDKIIGHIGLTDKRVDALMRVWSTDRDFWLRRLAIDHQLGRKEQTNIPLLAAIISNNFGSDEFFINKAIGWSLRDYSKVNPHWVRQFIEDNRDQMHPLSIREGSKYI